MRRQIRPIAGAGLALLLGIADGGIGAQAPEAQKESAAQEGAPASEKQPAEKQAEAKKPEPAIPEFSVVVDPGHGGAAPRRKDDRWDPVTGGYLSRANYGAAYGRYHEHELMLALGKSLHKYLTWTESDAGWRRFEELLKKLGDRSDYPRIRLQSAMTRDRGWEAYGRPANHPDVNAPFRMYDYPDERGRMQPGRLSWINQQRPYLVVSLHLTPAGPGNPGGMGAVLSPGYQTFDLIRRISLGELPRSRFQQLKWRPHWLITVGGWSKWDAARSDAWVYFHGFRTRKGEPMQPWLRYNRGIRQNLITWRYAEPPGWEKLARLQEPGPYTRNYREYRPEGKFWDRERSQAEAWRREGGVLGYGGDNHYATDELMRFAQYGVRRLAPDMRAANAIGPIQDPFVSSYTLPIYVNAVVAYLEIGHINRSRDRKLVIEKREELAQSLAAGVYSLFRGLPPQDGYGPVRPRGRRLDFARYETLPEGNYFRIVAED